MDKKISIKFILYVVLIMMIFPGIINGLMFFEVLPVKGEISTWIGTLGTFWGAIIGGVVSGTITLIGVQMTIRSSEKGIKETLIEQKIIREEELNLQIAKDRLYNLYHPINVLGEKLYLEYGALRFSEINQEDQKEYIVTLLERIVYADKDLYKISLELQWLFKENEFEYNRDELSLMDQRYVEIQEMVTKEMLKLREKLNLPSVGID